MATRHKIMVIGGILALVVVAAGVGHEVHGFGGPKKFGFGMKALMDLDLTDAQKIELKEIFDAHEQEIKAARAGVRKARKQFKETLADKEFDESLVRQSFREMIPALEEAALTRTKMFLTVKAVLTPDQIETLEERRQTAGERIQKMGKYRKAVMEAWLTPESD